MTRTRLGTALAIVAIASVVGAVFGLPGSGRAATTGAPVNVAPPSISGTAQNGQTLTAGNGGWSESPTSYAYVWSQCDAGGNSCAPITGATAATYTAGSSDVGYTLRVSVTASNAVGSAQATSAQTAVVSSKNAPTDTAAPSISGSVQIGSTLTASPGSWSGDPTAFAYAWSRCDASGDSCATIDGATTDTYTVLAADAAATLRVSVTATNVAGSTQATSAQTAAAPAPDGCPAGTGTIQIADLLAPARLAISHQSIEPHPVTLATRSITLHFRVTACNGRPVQGAAVQATAIPFNQFAAMQATTGADGTVTLTEARRSGFPARRPRQDFLTMFVSATQPGHPALGGVSTRRVISFRASIR